VVPRNKVEAFEQTPNYTHLSLLKVNNNVLGHKGNKDKNEMMKIYLVIIFFKLCPCINTLVNDKIRDVILSLKHSCIVFAIMAIEVC